MKRLLCSIALVFTFLLLFTGCNTKSGLKDISYQELKNKLENKETFILEVVQTGCSACQSFTPRFEEVLKEHQLLAYSINITNLSEKDREAFDQIINITGTPNVLFYKDGEEESVAYRIVNAASKEKIIQKLKAQGYIK